MQKWKTSPRSIIRSLFLKEINIYPLFWRNMETHREPDIHVKTVLTFVAKLAPTMMQFSLRKTAQESKAGHPEVAKVLTSNMYQMRSGNLQIQKRKLGN